MAPSSIRDSRCFHNHLGIWLIEPAWLFSAIDAIRSGALVSTLPTEVRDVVRDLQLVPVHDPEGAKNPLPPGLDEGTRAGEPVGPELRNAESRSDLFALDQQGVAVIQIRGEMTKGDSSFAGASSVRARRAVRAAAADSDARAILLVIDSPGGTAAGTQELADAVFEARAQKPVHAHIDDFGASAAYWVASQAGRVTANESAQVGSIGTMAVIADTSKMAEDAGIKVHVISTGAFKGAGTPGTKITDEQLKWFQTRVDDLNQIFLDGLSRGRGAPRARVEEWADGRVFIASKALELGLIDGIASIDEALAEAREAAVAGGRPRARAARAAIARAEIDAADRQ